LGANGFSNSHQVGIWDTSSNLLASATIPAGTSAALIGPDNFRFVALGAPVTLGTGSYLIGAHYLVGDADSIAQDTPVGAPGFITYAGPRLSGTGFAAPTSVSAATGGAFGPNFEFQPTAAAVPEPLTLVIWSVGALGMAVRTWRQHKRGRWHSPAKSPSQFL